MAASGFQQRRTTSFASASETFHPTFHSNSAGGKIPARRTPAPAGSAAKSRTWTPSAVVRGVGLKRCRQGRARQCLHRQGLLLQGPHSTCQPPEAHEAVSSGHSWDTPAGICLGLCSRVAQPGGTWPSPTASPAPLSPLPKLRSLCHFFCKRFPAPAWLFLLRVQ